MGNFFDSFETAFNRLTHFLISLVAISIGLVALLIPLNLFLIKTRLGAMWWLYEGVEYALYAGVFLGAPWVLQQGAHVRVDIFTTALPNNLAAKVEQALDLAGSILCLILFVYGLRGAMLEFEDGTLPDKSLRIDNWIILTVFALSFFMLAIEFFLRFRRAREILEIEKHTTQDSRDGI